MTHRIVFDFDGPLFDGRAASATALEATAKQFGDRLGPPERITAYPLLPPRTLIPMLYPEADGADRVLLREFYEQQLQEAERKLGVTEQVRAALEALAMAGCRLALYSGRPAAELNALLDLFNLTRYFLRPADGEIALKPSGEYLRRIAEVWHVQPADMVFVGDSDADCLAAKEASVPYYHASWTGEPCGIAARDAALRLASIGELRGVLMGPHLTFQAGADPLEELRSAVQEGRFCFYAGAGVSVPSGIGDWRHHYLPVLDRLGASHLAKEDLPEVLQLLAANPFRARRVYDAFRDSFEPGQRTPNPYHYAMLRSRAERIWTSNYDTLFEAANTIGQFGHRVVRTDGDLLESLRSDRMIIKMNGDFETARFHESLDWGLVLLQEQFDRADRMRPEIWRLFEDDYRTRTILFVGVSFRDPVLRRIVALARQKVSSTRYNHFFLARKESGPAAWGRQAMFAENLQRSFIVTLFKDGTDDIRHFVERVAMAATRPIVGFSGDVGRVQPDAPVDGVVPEGLKMTCGNIATTCRALAEELARRRLRVTSGHSPFVGIPAVVAAYEVDPGRARFYLRKHGRTRYERSAPGILVPGDLPGMREKFISELSLLVAIGGKAFNGPRSGVLDEIDLALERRIPVLLLPQAGGAVAEYMDEFRARAERAYPDAQLRDALKAIQEKVNGVPAADLPTFARDTLPGQVESLISLLMGASFAWGDADARADGLQW